MDSQVPNIVVEEGLRNGKIQLTGIHLPFTKIKREQTYGHSRFDVYCETEAERIFVEVKGVTLEENGIVMFPDAPTERGVKHIEELIVARQEGYKTYVVFVVQMDDVRYFRPHEERHPEFAAALRKAEAAGVGVLAYTCKVTPNGLEIHTPLKVVLA